ncbi:hypothetical protein ACE1B4_07240 [Aeromonas veronii]|uniref:hypothetical protein n=1 Tax=Aeromonas veronii TaxID=654 RepID=UPI0011171883|nr:hypothetical protein [Aeromonas veronii]HDO1312673.1 hypothetical protein [Aeromonas veronii]
MSETRGFEFTINIQTVGIFIAALGTLAALISAWFQVVPGRPELEAKVTHVEEFSAKPKIEGLTGEFTYKGSKIENLITLRVKITNTGNKTIIGKGEQKNIIGETLSIDSQDYISIVDVTLLSNDINANILKDESSISFSFNQWRPNESIDIFVYINANKSTSSNLLVTKNREIIDGDFRVVDASTGKSEQNPLNNYISAGYVKGLKVFGYLSLAVVFPVFMLLIIEPFKSRYQALRWKKMNSGSFGLFIDEKLSFLSESEREIIKGDPELLSKVMLKGFDGGEYPSPFVDTWREGFILTFIFTSIVLGLIPLFVGLHFMY